MTKKKKPITGKQITDVEDLLADVCDEVAFLEQIFINFPRNLENHHFYGLYKIVSHIHADSYKVLDALDRLETQVMVNERRK